MSALDARTDGTRSRAERRHALYTYLRRVGETRIDQGDISWLRARAKADGLAISTSTTRDHVNRSTTLAALVSPSNRGEIVRPDAQA